MRTTLGARWAAGWIGGWIGAGPLSGAAQYVAGKVGQAVRFDGAGQTIRVAHDPRLKPAGGITLAAWVRPGPEQGRDWRHIYRKEDGNARHLLALGRTGPISGLWVGLGIGGQYVEFGAPASLDKLKDGPWHHVAAAYDAKALTLFLDGRPIGSRPLTGALDTAGGRPAFIGSNAGTHEFFAGDIDDLRIYDRGLSTDEIGELFVGRGVEKGLVGWWKLDGEVVNAVSGAAGEPVGFLSPAPLLRKSFHVAKEIARARVYLSGIGWSELYLNGVKVGDRVLDPAATDYPRRVFYVTHDVTAMLQPGENVLGVILGNGWYSEPPGPNYGDSPRLRLQMNLAYADGSGAAIVADESWKTATGPIIGNDMYHGEVYDARLERPGWDRPGFDDSNWTAARSVAAPGGVMQSQMMPPMRVTATIRPVRLTNPARGVYVYHLPQLFGGWVRFRVKGPAGAKISLELAQRLDPRTGMIDNHRHPEPKCTDYYILKGDPAGEVFEPRFTFHPIQYVEIEGHPGVPALEDLEGRAVHTDIDLSGDFECSNELFNRIHRNAVWTLRNEVYGILMDCLYREHWGWLEPGTTPSTFAHRQYMPQFWEKYLDDAKYAQHDDGVIPDVIPAYPVKGRKTGDVAWAGNYPLAAWYIYQYYDDRRALEQHYPSMKKWMEHLIANASGDLFLKGYYGDHMLPGPEPGREEFLSAETPKELIRTAFYYRNALILAQTAKVLGQADDAREYFERAGRIRRALNERWFDTAQGVYAGGSQTANFLGLAFGLVPEGYQSQLIDRLAASIRQRDHHFHTGNVGTACLMDAGLVNYGLGEIMYRVMNQTTYPGWGYMVAQGATTLWEGWGLRDDVGLGEESMDMWGVVEDFFYRDLAGIGSPSYYGPRVMQPGFREIDIRPHVLGDLTWAKASIRTVRGVVSSHWTLADGVFTLKVNIPVNSTGRISMPVFGADDPIVREGQRVVWEKGGYVPGAEGISDARLDGGRITLEVGSGAYTFSTASGRRP
ncbi:MAG: family 78 glycoside hydrolase catalytic domain [Phycisphaerae bacterium]|jgi:alpha-L-rhamnosidase